MTSTKKYLMAATAISLIAAGSWFAFEAYSQSAAQAATNAAQAQIHGEGKMALSCDMSILTINYKGEDTIHAIDTLINLDAEQFLHDGKGSKRMMRQKIMPMAELIKNYPDAQSVEFKSCDSEEGKTVAIETLKQDPTNYLITLNNRNRARIAMFQPSGGKGVKYHTAVKNLYLININ